MAEAAEIRRIVPRQARSRAVVDAILEAAAQLLELAGETGFTTNRIAERAGVGVGSLYRYSPDKRSILVEMARRESICIQRHVIDALRGRTSGAAPDRLAFLGAFAGRVRARRAALLALLAAQPVPEATAEIGTIIEAMNARRPGEPL